MLARIFLGIVVLFPFAAQSGSTMQPLNVKLGLWEGTWTTTMTGVPPIPDSALAQMPPDQRAKIQQMIQERMNGKPTTTQYCLTKDKLDSSKAFQNVPKRCMYTVVSSTSSKLEMKMECTDNDTKMSGNFVVEAVDSEHVKGSVHMNTAGGNNTMNANSTFNGKWLGAACGNVQ